MATMMTTDDLTTGVPSRADGLAWPYAMATDNGTLFADTVTELVAELIPGYAGLPETADGAIDALHARYEAAVSHANLIQGLLAAVANAEGEFDAAAESESTLTALFADREQFVADFTVWDHQVPVVLIATDYAPYTDVPRPSGNITWLDPATETSLLQSLRDLGVILYFVASDGLITS